MKMALYKSDLPVYDGMCIFVSSRRYILFTSTKMEINLRLRKVENNKLVLNNAGGNQNHRDRRQSYGFWNIVYLYCVQIYLGTDKKYFVTI